MASPEIIRGYDAAADMETTTTIDPVCGMTVDPAHAAATSPYDGETIFFCRKGCKAKFDADPKKYMSKREAPPATGTQKEAASTVIYTCPMHPEVRQNGPGVCPKCGMELEP